MAGSPCCCRTSLRPGSSSSTASSGCSSWPTTTIRSTWRPGTWPACFQDSGEVFGSLVLALMESLFQDRIRRRDSGSGGDPKGVPIDEGRVWRADQRHRYRRGRAPEGEGEDKQVLFGEDRNITYVTLMLLKCLYPQTRSNPLLMLFLFQAPPVSWDVEAILQRGRDGRHDTTAAKVRNTEIEREWIQTNGKKGPNWLTLHYPLGKGRVQLSMPRGWTWWPSKMNLLFAFNCVSYTFYCLRYSDQLDSCFIMSAGIRVWHIDHLNCFLIKILAGTCRQVCSSVEIKRPSSLSTASTWYLCLKHK